MDDGSQDDLADDMSSSLHLNSQQPQSQSHQSAPSSRAQSLSMSRNTSASDMKDWQEDDNDWNDEKKSSSSSARPTTGILPLWSQSHHDHTSVAYHYVESL